MVLPTVKILLKIVAQWVLSCCMGARKALRIFGFSHRSTSSSSTSSSRPPFLYPGVSKCSRLGREGQTLVCDIQGTLLRSTSPFPFFMLVAFEGGSILRALVLLLSYPPLWLLNHDELSLKVMTFISFCCMRTKDVDTVTRAVLPKFYLEDLNPHAYEVLVSCGKRVVLTCMPRIMVERFLREYLAADEVVGTELQVVVGGRFYSGLVAGSGIVVKHRALKDLFGDIKADLALGSSSSYQDHQFLPLCKEAYVVTKEERSAVLRRERYPKPLVFHDGRLAFFPTPLATLALFLWLPLGLPLAIIRALLGICIPYSLSAPFTAATGITLRVKGLQIRQRQEELLGMGHVLYVCTHRTLLDPVAVSTALGKPMTAVTYSLSRVSELISPIKTVRLTRDRVADGATMQRLLEEGDLVVCPEGTTCREPYLLRFSPLFAELTDEIVPVAVDVGATMFYGTTASGYKWLDPLFVLLNPKPSYRVEFLPKVAREMTCGGGGRRSCDVANWIQRELAAALGFECTSLTRRDKYLMLAGHEGRDAVGRR